MTVRVKICGITNLGDARAAIAAGADMLGFILYPPSKRAVSRDSVRGMASRLHREARDVVLVGVFVNETLDVMAATLNDCELDLAQLSGDEPAFMVCDSSSPLFGRSFKAIRPASFAEAEAEAEWYVPPSRPSLAPSLLIDTFHPSLHGGTGEVGDWELAARLSASVPGLMLAGGLTPDNVGSAVRAVAPFAVDVASGVEASPGHKDIGKVRAFVERAKAAGPSGRGLRAH